MKKPKQILKMKLAQDAGEHISGYEEQLTLCISQSAQQEESVRRQRKKSHEETKTKFSKWK